MREWVVGRNPVYEVVRARRRNIFRLVVAEGVQEKGHLAEIIKTCQRYKAPIERAPRQALDKLGNGHQGIAIEVSAYPYSNLADILDQAQEQGESPLVLILDTLQDPQNLGTLLRTAEIMGVHGVLLPFRHSATITPAVVSASSGATEHLHIAQLNLAQAIRSLKDDGLWIIGLEASPQAKPPEMVNLNGPLALVVGNENEGIRSLVRESCDALLRLPMRGKVESLNAAVAGSIALYLVRQARDHAID